MIKVEKNSLNKFIIDNNSYQSNVFEFEIENDATHQTKTFQYSATSITSRYVLFEFTHTSILTNEDIQNGIIHIEGGMNTIKITQNANPIVYTNIMHIETDEQDEFINNIDNTKFIIKND